MNRKDGLKKRAVWQKLPLLLVAVFMFSVVSLAHGDDGAVAQPPGLTLPEALDLAAKKNPGLAAFAWDVRAAGAMVEQAGLRPNPELSVEIEDIRWTRGPSETVRSTGVSTGFAGGALTVPVVNWEREKGPGAHSGFSESEVTISIAQAIELGKKRAKRVTLAEREKELVIWDYQAARANVLAQTASDFAAVLAAQERVALEEDLVALAEEVVQTFSRRVEAGQVSPLELSRAEVALGTARVAHEDSQRELASARAFLAANWGGKESEFGRASGRLDAVRAVLPFEELEARLKNNPDVARWSSELAARDAAFALERAQRIPDVTVELGFRSIGLAASGSSGFGLDSAGGFGYTRNESGFDEERDNTLVLGFSLPLALFDRNQGAIAAADAMVSKASDERRAAESAAYAELAAAHQAASGAYVNIERLRDDVLPTAGVAFDKVQEGYRQGKFTYLDVLDAQRALFDVRDTYLRALARYHENVVRMERLTGQLVGKLSDNGIPETEKSEHAE